MEHYVGETLESILASDYPNLEVVAVDDGSTDRSLEVVQRFAERDERVRVFRKENSGVCDTRNFAISQAHGTYILPVDADNLVAADFITKAVAAISADEQVKMVYARAEFFGDRTGEWRLPPFSLRLLARKNMLDTFGLYRKTDWERVGGYCREIVAREDWDFWISVLKDGGKVVRLPETGLYYRVRRGSKRESDRALKHHVIDVLNSRHADFFRRELGGPLRYHRSWSRFINFFFYHKK